MAYVPGPKDLTKVKTKVAMNLTKRQLICFGLAAITGVPFYLLTKKIIGPDISAILMVTMMLPFFFMAMYEKDGLPLEKVLGNMIRQKFINPPIRKYKTENFYGELDSLVKKEGVPSGKKAKAGAEKATAHESRKKKSPGQAKAKQKGKQTGKGKAQAGKEAKKTAKGSANSTAKHSVS